MGSNLKSKHFAEVVNGMGKCPQVLMHLENTKKAAGIDFHDAPDHPNRIFLKGKCDEIVTQLAKDCGWDTEFKAMIKT